MAHGGKYTQIGDELKVMGALTNEDDSFLPDALHAGVGLSHDSNDDSEMTNPLEEIVRRGADNRDSLFENWEWKALAIAVSLFLVLVVIDVMAAIGVDHVRMLGTQDTYSVRSRP